MKKRAFLILILILAGYVFFALLTDDRISRRQSEWDSAMESKTVIQNIPSGAATLADKRRSL